MKSKSLQTSHHAESKFAPHGNIEMWPEGSVIHYDITGPFNLEVIKAFGRTVSALLATWQPQGPFASISFWHGSMMTTLDALAAYRQLLIAGRAYYPQEIINVWFVPLDIEGRGIMLPKWQKVYAEGGYPLEIVATEAEARERVKWHLQQAGVKLEQR